MTTHTRRIAVFPGAFDPVTNGHMDIIRRATTLFDEVIVAVGDNPAKQPLFTREQRCEMLRLLTRDMPTVRVESYTGLTVDFARSVEAVTIIRGVRSATDLSFESQLALTNRTVAGIETVFILPDSTAAFITSTLVRQIAAGGGNVSALVPTLVADRLAEKTSNTHQSPPVSGARKKRRQGRGA